MTAVACLWGCDKETINPSDIIGKWADVSALHYGYSSDGSTYYTFNEDGTCELKSYDALSGNTTSLTYGYTWDADEILTIIRDESDVSRNSSYHVIKLDDREMVWKKTGENIQDPFIYEYWNRTKE